MKRLWIVLFLCSMCVSITTAQTGTEALQQAEIAYNDGDYQQAITLYETVIANGAHNSEIYFNLGNAYYLADDLGRALLNYRRAHVLNPRNSDIDFNLTRVRGQRIDIQGDETAVFDTLAALTSGTLTVAELGWIALGIWSGGFILLALYIRRIQWHETLRVPLIIIGTLVIMSVILLSSRLYVEHSRPAAVIVAPAVLVRSGPGENYLQHFQIHAAAEIRILEIRDGWIRFTLPDGRQGWIPQASAEEV